MKIGSVVEEERGDLIGARLHGVHDRYPVGVEHTIDVEAMLVKQLLDQLEVPLENGVLQLVENIGRLFDHVVRRCTFELIDAVAVDDDYGRVATACDVVSGGGRRWRLPRRVKGRIRIVCCVRGVAAVARRTRIGRRLCIGTAGADYVAHIAGAVCAGALVLRGGHEVELELALFVVVRVLVEVAELAAHALRMSLEAGRYHGQSAWHFWSYF